MGTCTFSLHPPRRYIVLGRTLLVLAGILQFDPAYCAYVNSIVIQYIEQSATYPMLSRQSLDHWVLPFTSFVPWTRIIFAF